MKRSALLKYCPLVLVTAVSFAIKIYDPMRSPVLAAQDPWGWTIQARQFLATRVLDPFFTQTGYPPTFMYFVAGLSQVFQADPYEVVRFLPILTALNVIPIYLLALEIFQSHKLSALASLLAITGRFYFMRTSIGIPEGLAQLFFTFALLFLLKSITAPNWRHRVLAAGSISISLLYYHFTFIILIPLLLILPITFWSKNRIVAREIGFTSVPAFFFAGVVWYLQVLPNMVQFYLGSKISTYARPTFENSASGMMGLIAYGIAKSGILAFAELGYIITLFALLGVAYLLSQKSQENKRLGSRLLLTYFAILIGLTLMLRLVYDLGVSGAGDSSVYMFSWLTIPAAIFAASTVIIGINHIDENLPTKSSLKRGSQIVRVTLVCVVILLTCVNLSSFNYYKAPAGGSPIPNSFYYYRPMTDQEYYALTYIRDNTPPSAQILEFGLDQTILVEHAVVAKRTIVAITDMMVVDQTIEFSGQVIFPDTHHQNITFGTIRENSSAVRVLLITGIRDVSLEVARTHGEPPATIVLNEQLLARHLSELPGFQIFYENDQITVGQVPLQIQSQG